MSSSKPQADALPTADATTSVSAESDAPPCGCDHSTGAATAAAVDSPATSSGSASAAAGAAASAGPAPAAAAARTPLVPLTGRLSVPLAIPISTDLVRKPRPSHGVDAVGTLSSQPLGHQKRHATAAVQALVARESCIMGCDSHLHQLSSTLAETDHLMAQLVDGMGRLDLVLAAAAAPIDPRNGRGAWCSLKPQFKHLLAEHAKAKKPSVPNFKAGMMAEHAHATAVRAAASAAASAEASLAALQVAALQAAASPTSPSPRRTISASSSASVASPSTKSMVVHSDGVEVPVDPLTHAIIFRPVGVQPPICRHYQKAGNKVDASCPLTAEACPYLHVFEADCKPFRAHCVDELADPVERAAAWHGVPYILYHLAVGEEAQYSLFRRTLDQHAPLMRRTLNLRHALLHWAPSMPADRMRAIMRPGCRILHFPAFTQLTHKHRFQSCLRKHVAKLKAQEQASIFPASPSAATGSTSPTPSTVTAPQKWRAFGFLPTTLLLPSDRLQLLALHQSLGGTVDAALMQEAMHPSATSRKVKRKEKRSHEVGDVVIQASSEVELQPQDAAMNGATNELSPSPPAAATLSPALCQQFVLPDFLANYPLHHLHGSTLDSTSAAEPPIWILKPYARGSGHGIVITDFSAHVRPEWITGQYVATRYVHRPLLIDKNMVRQAHEVHSRGGPAAAAATAAAQPTDLRKFDLRLYVLLLSPFFPGGASVPEPVVGSTESPTAPPFPFQVFLYTEGLARFASHTYDAASVASDRLGTNMDSFTHLTNNAINITNDARKEQAKGCWENCDLNTLEKHFDQQRANMTQQQQQAAATNGASSPSSAGADTSSPYAWQWSYVWSQIRHLVVHSLCVSDEYLAGGLSPSNRCSFELFGLDVLIDPSFKVHMCEINSMPDLNASNPLTQYHATYPVDYRVKSRMLVDVLNALQLSVDEPVEPHDATITGDEPSASCAPPRPSLVHRSQYLGGFERLV